MNVARVLRAFLKSGPRLLTGPVLLLELACLMGGVIVGGVLCFGLGPIFLAWLSTVTHADWTGFWGMLILMILSFPLIYFVSVLLLSLLAFPWLRRRLRFQGGPLRNVSGSVQWSRQLWEASWVTGLGLSVWVLSLLLFWIPPLSFALSFTSLVWMQYRLMTFEIWSETQSLARLRELQQRHRSEALLLSAGVSAFALVPFLNFLLPVFSALIFLQWDQELSLEEI